MRRIITYLAAISTVLITPLSVMGADSPFGRDRYGVMELNISGSVAGDLHLNGNDLCFDTDDDSCLFSDADDVVKLNLNGLLEMTWNTTSLLLSGMSLDMDGNDIILDSDGDSIVDVAAGRIDFQLDNADVLRLFSTATSPAMQIMDDAGFMNSDTSSRFFWNGATEFRAGSTACFTFSSDTSAHSAAATAGLCRVTGDVVKVTTGTSGNGDLQLADSTLTSGTMTYANQAIAREVVHKFTYTNAMVTALPGTAGDIAVGTLPAKTIVKNAYVVIDTGCTHAGTVTISLGRTGAGYIDYIVASDAKAAANTVYGDASAERGTNLTMYDMPSYTGTTLVNAHFISTVANLSTATTCTGTIIMETATLP